MKTLAILGAGGHGKVVADAAICAGWSEIAFFDDSYASTCRVGPWNVVGTNAEFRLRAGDFEGVTVAIGDSRTRLAWIDESLIKSSNLVSIVHPFSYVSRHAQIGAGSMILAGAVVNPFARLGRGCIVNSGATVDHDCELADAVHVSPGAHLAGSVRVGTCSWIGIGASVRQGIAIGAHVIVGAGAAVVHDVMDGQTVVGVPARNRRAD